MKKKILKLVRILITTLMVLSVLVVSVLPAAAVPPSFDTRDLFPPFHMSLEVSILTSTENAVDAIPALVPLPSFGYDFVGEVFSNSYAVLLDDNEEEVVANINILPPFEDGISMGTDYIEYDFELESDYGFLPYYRLWLKSGFLSPEFNKAFEGFDSDLSYFQCDIVGEFYVGQYPYESYRTHADGVSLCLTYYEALYYSNFPFLDKLPSRLDQEDWQERYEVLEGADFSDLTPLQLQACQYCFDWVGPLYGSFSFDFVCTDNYCMFSYHLTDHDAINRIYETVLEDSAYSGYTGFEKVTHFLGSAVQGFFSVEILPDFSLGSILVVIIAFSLVLWWLKVFAGG